MSIPSRGRYGNEDVIVIIGPTGVGKSAFAEQLGKKLPIHIVNGDMGQFYSSLSIGTAKPKWQESTIPHHLFDIFSDPVSYAAPAYRNKVAMLVQEIQKTGAIPVIVGGSTLYMLSLFFAPRLLDSFSFEQQQEASARCSIISDELCWQALYEIDPLRASQLHKNDIYRIRRALMQWYLHGEKPSSLAHSFMPIAPHTHLIHLDKKRRLLQADLNLRICSMIEQGWLSEVEQLIDTAWRDFWKKKGFIGYEDICQFIIMNKQHNELSSLIDTITIKTIQYAKKQNTFWKMLKKSVEFAQCDPKNRSWRVEYHYNDLTFSAADLYINQLSMRLKGN